MKIIIIFLLKFFYTINLYAINLYEALSMNYKKNA